MSLHQYLVGQDWRNQMQDRVHYFHTFPFGPKTIAGWSMLSTSPYLPLFLLKFMHMEQAGIVARLSRQYSTFKPNEPEDLEPLKLQHFYITMIGIICGLCLAALSFVVEFISNISPSKLCVKKICI